MKYILVLMADGCEEVEALAPVDILRRAKMNVQTVACTGSTLMIEGSHKIFITCDIMLCDVLKKIDNGELPDAVVCPGGTQGAENLAKSTEVSKILHVMDKAGKIISANCAAPAMVFGKNGFLKGRNYTCYPGMQIDSGNYIGTPFVVDGNMLTGNGPGASFVFSLKLLELLSDHQTALHLKDGMGIQENF
jgi:4-methyl-5(b-hydroxyethyl)-thiazole monophosphate biosynthesis